MSEKSLKVDMVGTARNVQWTPEVFLGHGSIKLVAPAKVNLFLAVGDRRVDGYHEVTNIMHALALHDALYLHCGRVEKGSADAALLDKAAAGEQVDLPEYYAIVGPQNNLLVYIDTVDKGGVGDLDVPACDNIIAKAIDRLAREVGYSERAKVAVRLEKNIPHQGGLGGGSSDAAATLVGLARLWGVAADGAEVSKVACGLGADVAFFLDGGCAQFAGAGEEFVRALPTRKDAVLLIKPEGGVSTPAAYAAFDEKPEPIEAALLERAHEAQSAADVPLVNNLAAASETLLPVLTEVREWAAAQTGVQHVMLCGSGATTFAITEDFSTACELAAAAQLKGWWARATMMSSLRAAVRPK